MKAEVVLGMTWGDIGISIGASWLHMRIHIHQAVTCGRQTSPSEALPRVGQSKSLFGAYVEAR